MVAGFQTALVRGRTTEGMRLARVAGRLKGRPPKLNPIAAAHVVRLFNAGEHTTAQIADLLAVSRSTIYRTIQRAEVAASPPAKETPARQKEKAPALARGA